MKNKTIVMIGNMSWGMYKFRAGTMAEFIQLGYKVVVVAPRDEWSLKIEEMGCKFVHLEIDRKGTNPIRDLTYMLRLTKILIKLAPEIAISYTIKPVLYGTFASWLAGIPQRIAITTGLGYSFNSGNWIENFTKFLYSFFLRFASQVWFLNDSDLYSFVKSGLIQPQKTFLLPGEGIDTDFYCPRDTIHESPSFTLISRMLKNKGIYHFIESAYKLKLKYPKLNFYLVGPIDEGNPESISLDELKKINSEGKVKWLGPLEDVRDILSSTTCLVHPTFYKEGLPRVLLEAASMEVPSITTNIAGCKEVIIDGYNGLLVEPNDQKDLLEKMERFIGLPSSIVRSYSTNGRMHVQNNFSIGKINSIYKRQLGL